METALWILVVEHGIEILLMAGAAGVALWAIKVFAEG
jgi:hypothetical protein